jgi:hypothetical protein
MPMNPHPYIPSDAAFGTRPCAWRRGTYCPCQYCEGCPGEVPCIALSEPCATCRGCPGCPEDCDLCKDEDCRYQSLAEDLCGGERP